MTNHSLVRALLPVLFAFAVAVMSAIAAPASPPPTPASHPVSMAFSMDPLTWVYNIRSPKERCLHLSFRLDGEGATNVRAARVIIDHAMDDTGKELRNGSPPKFYHPAVGRTSGAELLGPIPLKIDATLTEVAPNATKLKELRGRVQLAIPAMHPDATVEIDHLASRFGSPIESESLRRAHVTLYVFGPGQSAVAAETAKIKNVSFAEQYLPATELAKMSPEQRQQVLRRPVAEIGENEVLLVVSDPEDRLVGVEFGTADGSSLVYNRNGFSHLENQGWRLSAYRLDRPATGDLKLVCWLALNGAIAQIPLIMNDVALPPWPSTPALQSTPMKSNPESDPTTPKPSDR